MTIMEYRDEGLFPHTTQPGLSLDQQMAVDAQNYDEYEESRRNHEPMTDHERAVGRELESKHAARASVLRQAQAERTGGQPQGPDGRPLVG